MRRILSVLLFTGLLGAGCSKKDASTVADKTDASAAAAPQVAVSSNPQITADLTKVGQNMQGQQYGEAVGTLLTLKDVPKSAEDEAKYKQTLIETSRALGERAKTDPRAQQSYQLLGQAMMGR
jgi:hypothetical protein